MLKTCPVCGKQFNLGPHGHQTYCSKECFQKVHVRSKRVYTRKEDLIDVKCAECGKVIKFNKNYVFEPFLCSRECMKSYEAKLHLDTNYHRCPICGKIFYIKPYRFNRTKGVICCSNECSHVFRRITDVGEGNHQYNVRGSKNASYIDKDILHKNNGIMDKWVLCENHPRAKGSRVTEHRLIVENNSNLYNPLFFMNVENFTILKDNVIVHHKDGNHDNNSIDNLVPLHKNSHIKAHVKANILSYQAINKIIGVLKQGKLLEGQDDNQHLINESSETSNNITDETLLQQITNIVEDYIVQSGNVINECIEDSIKLLEKEEKSKEPDVL